MDIFLYNTLSRTKERLAPLIPGQIGLYTCGPTVYNYAHIGNLRTFLFEDLLVRTLRFCGLKTTWVMNITDVGHLVSDDEEKEDKMDEASRREGKDPWAIAEFYTQAFLSDIDQLNLTRPDYLPRATEHIQEMIAVNQRLEEKGYTYTAGDALYFDTSKFPDYGKLARLRLDELKVAAREGVTTDSGKRGPADFVLWFSNKPDHIMKWESPWGVGYPGWHIECSAMSMKYLGETFDIHCGGNDHINIHHTNEIAQSECCTGHTFANIWMHTAFLTLGRDKMSKSSGGFLTVKVLTDSGYDPLAYRYLCLQAHYRSELELKWVWDDESTKTGHAANLDTAASTLKRLYERVARVEDEPLTEDASFKAAVVDVLGALADDLNVPRAVGLLHSYDSPRLWKHFDAVLGLKLEERAVKTEEVIVEVPDDIQSLVDERQAARKAKDFARSDGIRAQLAERGWELADTPQGPKVTRK